MGIIAAQPILTPGHVASRGMEAWRFWWEEFLAPGISGGTERCESIIKDAKRMRGAASIAREDLANCFWHQTFPIWTKYLQKVTIYEGHSLKSMEGHSVSISLAHWRLVCETVVKFIASNFVHQIFPDEGRKIEMLCLELAPSMRKHKETCFTNSILEAAIQWLHGTAAQGHFLRCPSSWF